jgi:hypothetical protein
MGWVRRIPRKGVHVCRLPLVTDAAVGSHYRCDECAQMWAIREEMYVGGPLAGQFAQVWQRVLEPGIFPMLPEPSRASSSDAAES